MHYQLSALDNLLCDGVKQFHLVCTFIIYSSLEINTTQINRTETIVHCVVEDTRGALSIISTGQLTVRDMACKLSSHVYTCIHVV